jgi:hypothetical protein
MDSKWLQHNIAKVNFAAFGLKADRTCDHPLRSTPLKSAIGGAAVKLSLVLIVEVRCDFA